MDPPAVPPELNAIPDNPNSNAHHKDSKAQGPKEIQSSNLPLSTTSNSTNAKSTASKMTWPLFKIN